MTDQEINIAIAEACGWNLKPSGRTCGGGTTFIATKPNGEFLGELTIDGLYRRGLPNYCHDLNAMHDAEKTLTDDQQESYVRFLAHGVMTTSHQRAEAFLRTLGKWKE